MQNARKRRSPAPYWAKRRCRSECHTYLDHHTQDRSDTPATITDFWRPRDRELKPGSSNSSTDRREIRDAQQQQLGLFPSLRFSSSSNSSSLLRCKQKSVKDVSCAFSSARGQLLSCIRIFFIHVSLFPSHNSTSTIRLAWFHPSICPSPSHLSSVFCQLKGRECCWNQRFFCHFRSCLPRQGY
jgi:hypothetical protein